jgi:hypothetical protein
MRNILFAVGLLATAACGTEPDDRPVTVDYLVPAILRPACATAACHSSATARRDVILDTIEGACESPQLEGFVSGFIDGAPSGQSRMPKDSPLPDADIALIVAWDVPRTGCP